MRVGIPIYDQISTFITDCYTYKRHSIICHEKSDEHIINMKKDNAKSNPDSTTVAKSMRV